VPGLDANIGNENDYRCPLTIFCVQVGGNSDGKKRERMVYATITMGM
jgi:hypothetical protein